MAAMIALVTSLKVNIYAGETVTDATKQTAYTALGGTLWPTTDTIVAAAAAKAVKAKSKGANEQFLDTIMLAGLAASLASSAGGSGASDVALQDAGAFFATKNVEAALAALAGGTTQGGAAAGVKKATCTITQAADLAGLGAGVKTFDKNIGAALPAGARIVAVTAEAVTDFDDATHGTFTSVVGTSAGGNQIGTSLNVAAGQAGFPKAYAAGAQGYSMAPQGGAQPSVRLTSSVDLNTATAGALTVNLFYVVQP